MDNAGSEMVQVAAARELLDRGYGKPAQTVEVQGGAPQNVFVIALTNPTRDPLARVDVTPTSPDEAIVDFSGVLGRPKGSGHAPNGHA
jgi:hypothetical protein